MKSVNSAFGAVVLTAAALVAGPTVATAAADDTPPPIVEDYDYPGADQIFAEHGIRLLKGDGHILFTDCATSGNRIEVWSRTNDATFCFHVTANKGYLSLDLAKVYLIKADDHSLKATMLVKGTPKVVDIEKNSWTSVGEGADPQNGPSSLLELNSGPA
ncbi:hypothetical protein MUY14_39145 [Amycolatopsis sp. FBCC-B4732]|uniref:hypothetical protein n=1 Tax=Amycolatopsis sp. FBCC-B4732 TaxID=3079339 RepID=UPI001FF671DE|nr:hypothetical protein [Amycolatopsis sp. FBCC-B4732]UOX87675.1 hypothetical protein MUY14_39145 [Amycolatopsis sp. FBCC-B4732]